MSEQNLLQRESVEEEEDLAHELRTVLGKILNRTKEKMWSKEEKWFIVTGGVVLALNIIYSVVLVILAIVGTVDILDEDTIQELAALYYLPCIIVILKILSILLCLLGSMASSLRLIIVGVILLLIFNVFEFIGLIFFAIFLDSNSFLVLAGTYSLVVVLASWTYWIMAIQRARNIRRTKMHSGSVV